MGIWYTKQRLAASSATSGINQAIRTAVLSMCHTMYICVAFILNFRILRDEIIIMLSLQTK